MDTRIWTGPCFQAAQLCKHEVFFSQFFFWDRHQSHTNLRITTTGRLSGSFKSPEQKSNLCIADLFHFKCTSYICSSATALLLLADTSSYSSLEAWRKKTQQNTFVLAMTLVRCTEHLISNTFWLQWTNSSLLEAYKQIRTWNNAKHYICCQLSTVTFSWQSQCPLWPV